MFDDENVSEIEESDLSRYFGDTPGTGSGYVLFYQSVPDLNLPGNPLSHGAHTRRASTGARHLSVESSESPPTFAETSFPGTELFSPPTIPGVSVPEELHHGILKENNFNRRFGIPKRANPNLHAGENRRDDSNDKSSLNYPRDVSEEENPVNSQTLLDASEKRGTSSIESGSQPDEMASFHHTNFTESNEMVSSSSLAQAGVNLNVQSIPAPAVNLATKDSTSKLFGGRFLQRNKSRRAPSNS